ncbi:GNAT family N-acetyltransferase [Flavobacteriaceae bacterium]|jgi:ribosomal protein S18 acetylase RimI-like enzyme|uniref:GNAT family N-acetyltransferase n=1 Tax=Candidatus Arcticimaribacter forsetii TaxID=2820661 RepID=UPI00207742F7|nr:GNAT family N-acetyltransferase [Candidatus Arcticimaribacter forsetii]MDA8698810.1 GNAT family N-acetyltransferase [Flavobacteriaceae bacterium]MDB2325925.1 GNAT family N-acetyltransferase [Flavobacteriaceae bacterium]MDB4609205.1 GNAT family N-acetyltransferase [Flavobacteriaceae bacterium]MDB4674230.1 GNAT family N-acetyltransferase [Flavobacteriaceae bacterium]MDB4716902.1 GNAT family N-acetyltransferase [Flavobacteriaceae bacterium]
MTEDHFEIRAAQITDIETLKEFEQGVIAYERPFASNLKKDPISYYDLKDLIARTDAQLLVLLIKNKIVASGYALIKKSPPYKNPEFYAYLGFMYVAPSHRGEGLNGILCKELIEWAKKQNITEVQLDVYAENESALSAYKKIGFKPDLLKMRLK